MLRLQNLPKDKRKLSHSESCLVERPLHSGQVAAGRLSPALATMVVYNFKKIETVPTASDFIDVILSKTCALTECPQDKRKAFGWDMRDWLGVDMEGESLGSYGSCGDGVMRVVLACTQSEYRTAGARAPSASPLLRLTRVTRPCLSSFSVHAQSTEDSHCGAPGVQHCAHPPVLHAQGQVHAHELSREAHADPHGFPSAR